MSYGLYEDDIRSSIGMMEHFGTALPTESVESLDSFLPQFHCTNKEQLEKENRIVLYLKKLSIQFKTDPRRKEHEYKDKQRQNKIIFQQTIGDSPAIGTLIEQVEQQQQQQKISPFIPWLNPFVKNKRQSFEL